MPRSTTERPRLGGLRAESSVGIAEGTRVPRHLALARQLLESRFLVVPAREGREESDYVVDVPFRQCERMHVFVEIGVIQGAGRLRIVRRYRRTSRLSGNTSLPERLRLGQRPGGGNGRRIPCRLRCRRARPGGARTTAADNQCSGAEYRHERDMRSRAAASLPPVIPHRRHEQITSWHFTARL